MKELNYTDISQNNLTRKIEGLNLYPMIEDDLKIYSLIPGAIISAISFY